MRPKVKKVNSRVSRLSYAPSNHLSTKYHHPYDQDGDTEDGISRNVRFAATPDLVAEDMASLMQLCSNTPEHTQASPWAGKKVSRKPNIVRYDTDFDSPGVLSPVNSEDDQEDDYEDLRIRGLKIHNQR